MAFRTIPHIWHQDVDADKWPQWVNLFPLGNNSANPSSNVNLIATFYTYQPENTVRIPLMLKLEIAYEERKIRRKNCEWVKINEFSGRRAENLVGNVKAFKWVVCRIFWLIFLTHSSVALFSLNRLLVMGGYLLNLNLLSLVVVSGYQLEVV